MSGYTIGSNYGGTSSSSAPGWDLEAYRRQLERDGYVVTERNAGRPYNHRMVGCGVGHDDARWAETRWTEGSMASYYENGESHGGRWFAPESPFDTEGVRFYGMRPRRNRWALRAHAHARCAFLQHVGRHDVTTCPWELLNGQEAAA